MKGYSRLIIVFCVVFTLLLSTSSIIFAGDEHDISSFTNYVLSYTVEIRK